MTRLLITRGLPASGKTTFARKLQPQVVRVNRDDLRRMMHGERLFTQRSEAQVTQAQRAAVEALLRAHGDVIVDDTNLRAKTVREWAELAARFGASFEVHDFTDVPLAECVRRDAERTGDERVGEDAPNPAVIAAVRAMHAAGHAIVFCSGRDEVCRAETQAWLELYVAVPYEGLFMRPEGDSRKDAIVKREIFDREIRDRWRVIGVFDDRQQVVRMWRALGLTVFQVAEGDF